MAQQNTVSVGTGGDVLRTGGERAGTAPGELGDGDASSHPVPQQGKQHRPPGKRASQSGADHSEATRTRRENRGLLVELGFISYDSYLIKYFICITLCSYSFLSS